MHAAETSRGCVVRRRIPEVADAGSGKHLGRRGHARGAEIHDVIVAEIHDANAVFGKQGRCRGRKGEGVVELASRRRADAFRNVARDRPLEIRNDEVGTFECRVDARENKVSAFFCDGRPNRPIKHHVAAEYDAHMRDGRQKLYSRWGCRRRKCVHTKNPE